MPTILQHAQNRPSFMQRLNTGVERAIEGGSQLMQEHEARKAHEQENEAYKKLTGSDLSGIRDPKVRQEAFRQAFEMKNENDYLDQIMGKAGNRDQNQGPEQGQGQDDFGGMSEGGMGQQPEETPQKGSKSGFQGLSDEQLVALTGSKKWKAPAQAEMSRRKVLARNQPIPPDQMKIIHGVRNQEGFDDMDEVGQYRAYTDAGVSPDYAEKESKIRTPSLDRKRKEFDTSYDLQKEFIEDTTQAHKGFETEMKPRLRQMVKLGEGEGEDELIGPAAATFLEFAGVPLGVLDNPSNELYHKLSQDLLKGLPETYGTRILKVEVENFLKTIPQLVNSANGRRMIASNMLKLGETKEAYYKEMRKQQEYHLSNEKPLPKDFQQKVFDNVKPQIDRITNEFVKMAEIKDVPKGTVPFFNPQGEVSFVPNNPQAMEWAEKNGGKRIW